MPPGLSERRPAIPSKPRVLIVGGYGVFGGRLARRLAKHADIDVIVAGRSLERARDHCNSYGGLPAVLDTAGDIEAALAIWQPTVIIDAAGPFQLYHKAPYRMASAALACGAHYLDLADDATFVAGIQALDRAARESGVCVLSGCSSVPAISAAAVRLLATGLGRIDTIEATILPGNRAPRGRSVMAAILAQVGKPLAVCEGCVRTTTKAWSTVTRLSPKIDGVQPLRTRFASPIGAPDLHLFPAHFRAATVRFMAGLELGIMHLGLAAIARLVSTGLLRSATTLTRPLMWLANCLEPFGTDRGAMVVDVRGRTSDGVAELRRWTLLAEAGDGPEIPPTPAYLLALMLCRKTQPVAPGARPCLDDLTLGEIEIALAGFAIKTAVTVAPLRPLFETALGQRFQALPPAIQVLHDVLDVRHYEGRARIDRSHHPLARLIGWCMRFPPAGDGVELTVEMRRTPNGETWTRTFGGKSFRSYLSHANGDPEGRIWERFGPLTFAIDLTRNDQALAYPVRAARFLGHIPLPAFLLPVSDTREYVDAAGRACFDVSISHPLAGFIVRYRGHLTPLDHCPAAPSVEPRNQSQKSGH